VSSDEVSLPNEDEIRYLPDSPVVYLSIMRTVEGVPRGTPIWSSFENREARTMENEAMASTFLSLSKSISEMTTDEEADGKIIRLNVNRKTYNIYIPHHEDEMQVCFVVVFEETENVLVKDEYKTELVKVITNTLRSIGTFRDFLNDAVNIRLDKGDELYDLIYEKIIQSIKKWDKKRVKYLKDKAELAKLEQERKQAEVDAQETDSREMDESGINESDQ